MNLILHKILCAKRKVGLKSDRGEGSIPNEARTADDKC